MNVFIIGTADNIGTRLASLIAAQSQALCDPSCDDANIIRCAVASDV